MAVGAKVLLKSQNILNYNKSNLCPRITDFSSIGIPAKCYDSKMFSLIKENWLVNEEEQFTMVGNQHNQMTWVKNIKMA